MSEERYQIGGYWLSRKPNSPNVQRTWYDADARQTRKASLGTSDWEEAKIRLALWFAENIKPKDETPETVSFATLYAHYLPTTETMASAKPKYIRSLHIKEFFADDLVSDLTIPRQKQFMYWCRAKGLGPRYISLMLSDVSKTLSHSQEMGYLRYAPKIKCSQEYVSEVTDLPLEFVETVHSIKEIATLFDNLKSEHPFRFMMLALNTMARPGPLFGLEQSQINRDHRLINLNPRGRRQNKKYRPTIPITDCLWAWLQEWREKRLITWHGKPINTCHRALQKIAMAHGIEGVTHYGFRHTMSANARNRGVPMDQVAVMLGHKRRDHRTTERYTKYDPNALGDLVSMIDDYMQELQGHCKRRLFPSDRTMVTLQLRSSGESGAKLTA